MLTTACGGDPVAPAPTIAQASITVSGSGAWVTCLPAGFGCNFQGDARNVGPGCASSVRGVTRFYSPSGVQLFSTQWGLGSRTVRPNEAFIYTTVDRVTDALMGQVSQYVTEPSWTNVPC